MKERPILFSGSMVRAILDGRKTMTRRVVKKQHIPFVANILGGFLDGNWKHNPFPYGRPGDRLWVRETFSYGANGYYFRSDVKQPETVKYAWKPSIHMPRVASRITLEVTSVRVERVQDITGKDALAEGIEKPPYHYEESPEESYRRAFKMLWDSINSKRGFGWDKNPWVWVVEFKKINTQPQEESVVEIKSREADNE